MKFDDYFKLKDVTINVTNSCLLNCVYCFEHDKNGLKMQPRFVEKIIDKCYNNYCLHDDKKFPFMVNFFGGEPFLAFDTIEHALKYAREKKYNITFGVTTNLTILDDHMIDVIEDYELGLLVSVDGIKEIHDRNRCNSYDTVIKNLKTLIDCGLKHLIEVRMTVMPADLPFLLDGIKELFTMGIDNIYPVPVTDTEWTEKDFDVLFEEMQRIWDWAFSVYNDENNKRNLSIKCIEDYMELVLEPIVQLEEQTKVCSAGTRSSISVGVTGDILPCHQRHTVAEYYTDLVIGNINSDEVREVKFNNQTIASIDNCDDCIAKAVCKGGCPSENLTQNKNGNLMNHTQCEVLRRMVAVAMLYQYKLVNGELKNIRSRRLNVLSENLKLLSMLQSLLFEEKNVEETEIALVKFYEKLSDIQDILLPSFSTVIKIVTDEMVNNVSSELKNMDE